MAIVKNPNTEFRKGLKKRFKSNGGYCLNKEKGNKDNKCPCKEFKETGECECGMYVTIPDELLGEEFTEDD